MRWSDEENRVAYQAWIEAWVKQHEHRFPSRVRTKNGRWRMSFWQKYRWKLAHRAWFKMRRQQMAFLRQVIRRHMQIKQGQMPPADQG
jgi:hypothetical protein